jgi:hypothetical protein
MENQLFVVAVSFEAYNPECLHVEEYDVEVLVQYSATNDTNSIVGIINGNNSTDVRMFLKLSNEDKEYLLKHRASWKKASMEGLRILDSKN